jgi:hypothetical protein
MSFFGLSILRRGNGDPEQPAREFQGGRARDTSRGSVLR